MLEKAAQMLLGVGKIIAGVATVITGAAWGCYYADKFEKKRVAKKKQSADEKKEES